MKVPSAQDNFVAEVWAAMKRQKLNITLLASSLGYSRETVSRAINQGEFPEVRRAIAAKLGVSDDAR